MSIVTVTLEMTEHEASILTDALNLYPLSEPTETQTANAIRNDVLGQLPSEWTRA